MLRWFWPSLFLLLSACGTVTIKTAYAPSQDLVYEEYFDGWLLGFAGEGRADLKGACPGDRVALIKVRFSGEDVALGTLTQGIYAPHSAKIYCASEVKNVANK